MLLSRTLKLENPVRRYEMNTFSVELRPEDIGMSSPKTLTEARYQMWELAREAELRVLMSAVVANMMSHVEFEARMKAFLEKMPEWLNQPEKNDESTSDECASLR